VAENISHKIYEILSNPHLDLNLSEKTKQSYVRHIKAFLDWTGEDTEHIYITRSAVQAYVSHLESLGRSPSTVAAHLSAILTFAHAVGSPVSGKIRYTKPAKTRTPKSLDRIERLRLLREVEKTRKTRDIAIIYMLLFTGLRVSELCALNIEDVTIRERSGSVHVRQGKGNKERTIPMPLEARVAVSDYLKKERPGATSGPLFVTNRGTRIQPRSVQGICAKFGTNPHALRHTYCRMLIAAGVDLVTVAALAGHENLQTTALYAQPTEQELSEAVSKAFNSGV
jgi:integrase/recombinase XerD